jgi:hypothetical protein
MAENRRTSHQCIHKRDLPPSPSTLSRAASIISFHHGAHLRLAFRNSKLFLTAPTTATKVTRSPGPDQDTEPEEGLPRKTRGLFPVD